MAVSIENLVKDIDASIQSLENQIKDIDAALATGRQQRDAVVRTCEELATRQGGLHPETLAAVKDANQMDQVLDRMRKLKAERVEKMRAVLTIVKAD